jgi:hypothetical protein
LLKVKQRVRRGDKRIRLLRARHAGRDVSEDRKRLPGNRAASSLGRTVPTEAKPSELSGCILSFEKYRVKTKRLRE